MLCPKPGTMDLRPKAQQVAAQAGITMVEPSTSVPRMRLDRVQAATTAHSPGLKCLELLRPTSGGLFGELTVYDATERGLLSISRPLCCSMRPLRPSLG